MIKAIAIHLLSHLSRIGFKMTNSCVFCKIIANETKASIVYRDEQVTAFHDKHPAAPTHILIVPNKHIESVNALEPADEPLVGHLYTVARKLAEQAGIAQGGYRLITNTGPDGGQSVFHLHVHLIGGKIMRHPTG
jgi:histidine triad (HIT) family protein